MSPTGSSASKPIGPMTGRRYIDSLRDGREVWIDGGRVDDVTAHPAFKGMIAELAPSTIRRTASNTATR
jgi:hypothetical protein